MTSLTAELPLEESAEKAKAGNYSLSLERVLFKLLCFQFCFLGFFFKFWKQRVAIYNDYSQQSLIKLAETEIPLKPTEKDVLEVTRKAVPL